MEWEDAHPAFREDSAEILLARDGSTPPLQEIIAKPDCSELGGYFGLAGCQRPRPLTSGRW
ncbi:hypothetical protein, partial [Sphingomonas yabuuchiae]